MCQAACTLQPLAFFVLEAELQFCERHSESVRGSRDGVESMPLTWTITYSNPHILHTYSPTIASLESHKPRASGCEYKWAIELACNSDAMNYDPVIFITSVSTLEKHSIINGDKISWEHKYNLCLSMLPRKCHFRPFFAGYYSNKSAVQHVLLNWIQLRLRERERRFNKMSCMNSSIQTCVVH